MAKHEVVCVSCGRMFDSESGGRYNPESRRYTCPECAALQHAALVAETAKRLKRNFIIKIVIGILFVLSGLVAKGDYSIGVRLGCIIVGAALLAWALIPCFKAKRDYREEL